MIFSYIRFAFLIISFAGVIGCNDFAHIGTVPAFSDPMQEKEHQAMASIVLTNKKIHSRRSASLWSRSQASLLGDRRALKLGDILTVLIEIDDKAEISNSSSRGRSAVQSLGIPDFFGLPQRNSTSLPEGASFENAVKMSSDSNASGDGSVKRKEKLELRIAATIIGVLPNGVLSISGSQEVRVNHELRELLVTGFVRPEDISRQNRITYDKIASARISYGGRGHISDVQQPRIGQQILEKILPF